MSLCAHLDQLMHRGWPALTNIDVDGWVVRLAGGVTARANSVLPARCPHDLEASLREVETLYEDYGMPAAFQISPAAQPAVLDALLAERGYERRSPTLVWTAHASRALQKLALSPLDVALSDEADEGWMNCWWSVDGRGDHAARAVAGRILASGPALYATAYDTTSVAAVGRLALVGAWGGVYCMAVRQDARRRGYGKAILRALLEEAGKRGVQHLWLQVVEENTAAQSLYQQAGFSEMSRYHYRIRPR